MRRIALLALALLAAGLLVALPATGADDGPYRVRGVFDNGSFIVKDEEVRIAGAKVGSIESVDVSGEDEVVTADGEAVPGKAVVVMRIDDDGFKDFRQDASCLVRPQSLIGERFIDCTPTQPRAPGEEPPPELEEIPEGEPGEGQLLLPLENNGKTIDLDLLQNINRAPYRDRFRLILNDLGAGLAARGDELGEIVDRANPALRQTNRVLKILADQSRQLDDLASDGDTVLEPLARNRTSITGFLTNARIAGEATAERSQDLALQFQKLPETLTQVRLTMRRLKQFADQGTPLMRDVGLEAKDISRATQKLAPFARAGVPALVTLGDAAEAAGPKIAASDPVIVETRQLTDQAGPSAQALSKLLDTLAKTDGIRYLMDFIYYSSASINSFDQYGHFLRASAQLTNCLEYELTPFPGCEAFFLEGSGGASSAARPALNGSGAKAAGIDSSRAQEETAPAPDAPLPPVDEIIPELEGPGDADEPTEPGGTTGPDAGRDDEGKDGEPAADPAAAAGSARVLGGEGTSQPLTMEDASLLLQFLLGGAS
jgi:phospholipid/cholesterol/gamma-HCH transport system substrate-binding protein